MLTIRGLGWRIWLFMSLVLVCFCVSPSAQAETAGVSDAPAMDAALHDLCDRKVVLLGEAGTHGDGHTIAFKVQLVQRLVDECHFKAVLFESNFYEFGHVEQLRQAGAPITPDQVSAAIGGLWNRDTDMQPLITFLADRANRRKLALGGVSDDIGQFGQTYANDTLPVMLTAHLEAADAAICRDAFKQRIYWDYTDAAPYDDGKKQVLQGCLGKIRVALPAADAFDLAIVASMKRCIDRDLVATPSDEYEKSMFLNFQDIAAHLPRGAKIIVWAATVHAAKLDLAKDGSETQTLGGYISQAYGSKAFALGFGAQGGVYGLAGQKATRDVPSAPDGSLEAVALSAAATSAYVDAKRLKALGKFPAALFFHTYVDFDWNRAVDGVVVFKTEVPEPSVN